jgi:hypothetical protein
MSDETQDLINLARFGMEVEAEIDKPLFQYILTRMVERVDEAKDKLATLDPELKASEIRRHQAEIARFLAMQEDIEQIVNEGRQAAAYLLDKEHVEDV